MEPLSLRRSLCLEKSVLFCSLTSEIGEQQPTKWAVLFLLMAVNQLHRFCIIVTRRTPSFLSIIPALPLPPAQQFLLVSHPPLYFLLLLQRWQSLEPYRFPSSQLRHCSHLSTKRSGFKPIGGRAAFRRGVLPAF